MNRTQVDHISPCTQALCLQSYGIQHYLKMLLIRSVIHLVAKPPDAFMLLSTYSLDPCQWGSPIYQHVVHQSASLSIWPAVKSPQWGPSTNPGATTLLLLFATTRSVVKSVKISVVQIANARIYPTGFRHRSSGDNSVECVVQSNRCLTSCGDAPQSVQMLLGSPNTLCL